MLSPKGFLNFFDKFLPCTKYTRPFNKVVLTIIHQIDTENHEKCRNVVIKMDFNFFSLVFAE